MRSFIIHFCILPGLLFPALASAVTPAISLSPTSLSFASQNIGVTSTAQTVTLTNSGTASLNITGIAANGDFAQTNNCGASIVAGASCILSISFTPTATGNVQQIMPGADDSLGMEINGAGFFILDYGIPYGLVYSLNGQFQLDKNGFIVNTSGHKLQGYAIDPTGRLHGSLQALTVPPAVIPAVATGASIGTGIKGIVAALNLDSRSLPPTSAFNPTDPGTFNFSSSMMTYDSKGIAQITTMYFVRHGLANQWQVYTWVTDAATGASLFPSPTPATGAWGANGILAFGTDGINASFIPNPAAPAVLPAGVTAGPLNTSTYISFFPAGAMPETIPFDFAGATQFGTSFNLTKLTQDGYTTGQVRYFIIGSDGIVLGHYSNGISMAFAQVTLATFPDAQGLYPLNNLDVTIQGPGFFQIQMPDGTTAYTRNGLFQIDSTGTLVTSSGYPMRPAITIPAQTIKLIIGNDGTATAVRANSLSQVQIGNIQLAMFNNPTGLQSLGQNLYAESASSGAPVIGTPGANASGLLNQGPNELKATSASGSPRINAPGSINNGVLQPPATTYAGTVTITSNAASSTSTISLIGTKIAVPVATLNFVSGWNLLGNSVNAPLDVAATLGDATKVTTVWKWIPATSKWAFYAPSMTAPNLATYATGKGYDVLTTINGGEGFWVNAKTAFTAQLPAGTPVTANSFQDQTDPALNKLLKGWNLIAIGDSKTPKAFATAISTTTSVAESVPTSLATLWAWDCGLASWYFYAPSLDNSGGLANYITSKGYLDFGTKTLDPTMGFWVNKPK